MNYGIFSQNVWLFPDSNVLEGKKNASLALLKKQTGAFQVIVSDITVGLPISVSIDGFDEVTVTVYR